MKTENKPLEGFTFLDFSHRLPGPLGGNILGLLGAKVIKVEDQTFRDPFIKGLFKDMDESFPAWYETLNEYKEVLQLDFSSSETVNQIQTLLKSADGILMGLPPKVQTKLGLDEESLSKLDRPLAVISMGSSQTVKKSMHDVNALAESGLLKLHIADQEKKQVPIAPPFLPISGISFGHKIATDTLAVLLKAQKQKDVIFHTTYLLESTEEILGPFWPKRLRESNSQNQTAKYLHNGLYPSYYLYPLKDQSYVAIALVEEKFWLRFCDIFELDLKSEERFFNKDDSIFNLIAKTLKAFTKEEIESKIGDQDVCLSFV